MDTQPKKLFQDACLSEFANKTMFYNTSPMVITQPSRDHYGPIFTINIDCVDRI